MNFSKETIQTVNSYTYMSERFMTAAFSKLVAQHDCCFGTSLLKELAKIYITMIVVIL